MNSHATLTIATYCIDMLTYDIFDITLFRRRQGTRICHFTPARYRLAAVDGGHIYSRCWKPQEFNRQRSNAGRKYCQCRQCQ